MGTACPWVFTELLATWGPFRLPRPPRFPIGFPLTGHIRESIIFAAGPNLSTVYPSRYSLP
jgi:hypothetical protein